MKKKNKTKNIIISVVITIGVVGLLSLIPYLIISSNDEEKLVQTKDEFKIDKMTYQIPEGFEYDDVVDENYKNYSFGEDSAYCYIDIEKYVSKYDTTASGESYLKRTLYIKLDDEVETKTEGEWFIVTIKEQDQTIRKVASIKYGDAIYTIDYRFNDYTNGENEDTSSYKTCTNAFEFVYNSIGFEK